MVGDRAAFLRPEGAGAAGLGAGTALTGTAGWPRCQPGGGAERDKAQRHAAPRDSSCRRVERACGRGGQRLPSPTPSSVCPPLRSSVVNPAGWPAEPGPHQRSPSPQPPPAASCHHPCPGRFHFLTLLPRTVFCHHAISFLETQPCDVTPRPGGFGGFLLSQQNPGFP